jgi:EDD domain protein, DegV family
MNDYVILTDSTTDLNPQIIRDLDVQVIPLQFTIGGKSYYDYADERELSIKNFYDMLRAGDMSTTAQINTAQYIDVFEPYLKEGKDVIYIGFSSGLSGSYNSSCMAAQELSEKYPNQKVYSVDSLAASMGEGLLVYNAVMQKRAGLSIDELKRWVEDNRSHLCHWFTVDDLHHLKRGGRVSSAAAVVGSMLGIKPVLHVDNEGHLIPVEKVRGRQRSLETLVQKMQESCIEPQNQVIMISHGDSLDDAKIVEELVRTKLHVKDVLINYIGPVIGTHSGPGTIALFFLGKNK